MSRDVFAFALDRQLHLPAIVALYSLLRHWPTEKDVQVAVAYLPDGRANNTIRQAFEGICEGSGRRVKLHFVIIDNEQMAGLPEMGHLSKATYLRLFLPDLLTDFDTLIYLDADILVRQCIAEVPEVPSGLIALAAVDPPLRRLDHPTCLASLCVGDRSIDARQPLRNTGVLVINVREWNRKDAGRKVLEFAKRHAASLRLADQDALNAVLGSAIGDLPGWWNHQVQFHGISETAAILHFSGGFKPWTPQIRRPPETQIWMREAKEAFAAAGISYSFWSARHRLRSLAAGCSRRFSVQRC